MWFQCDMTLEEGVHDDNFKIPAIARGLSLQATFTSANIYVSRYRVECRLRLENSLAC